MSEYKIAALEKHSGILRLILILFENGEVNFQKLIDVYRLYPTSLYPAINHAEELGIISVRTDTSSYPRKKMIKLTEKGERIADYISRVNDLL
jgi:DNA-binding MarR family transcriptional regulator